MKKKLPIILLGVILACHKWIEVFGGIILGLIIAGLMYFIR